MWYFTLQCVSPSRSTGQLTTCCWLFCLMIKTFNVHDVSLTLKKTKKIEDFLGKYWSEITQIWAKKRSWKYSWLPITRTFLGNRTKFELIGSLKQITRSKQISKKMRRECTHHAHFTGMDTEFELDENKKSNDKELTQLFWDKFGTFTSVH